MDKLLDKISFICQIDAALHGPNPSFIVQFEATFPDINDEYGKFLPVLISKGSGNECPYRMDYPIYSDGTIHRKMYGKLDLPWEALTKDLFTINFGVIRALENRIEGQSAKQRWLARSVLKIHNASGL